MFSEAERALERGQLNEALTKLRDRFRVLSVSLETQGLIYGFPKADALCQQIGASLLEEMRGTGNADAQRRRANPGVDVYLVSRIYEIGGHTGLIGDLVRASGGRRAHLLLTGNNANESDLTDAALARTDIPHEHVEHCAESSPLEQLKWLLSKLESLNPERVFLLHHPDDVLSTSAIQPQLADQFLFIHHFDNGPSLGVHACNAIHLDLTPFRYHYCRTWEGVEENVYLPLTCPDRHARNSLDWEKHTGILTTASSGSTHKFSTQHEPSYGETVACILKTTHGRHVHIGPLDDVMLEHIDQSLEDAGIERSSFLHIEQVDSLWQAMSDWKVDCYLSSFPIPGARASVEVIGSGTPTLWHIRSQPSRYEDTHMSYPEALDWKDLAELRQILNRADGSWLVAQSCAARRQYERLHDPKGWEAMFAGEVLLPTFSPPAFEDYRACNQGQRFREHWEAYFLLRENIRRANPIENDQPIEDQQPIERHQPPQRARSIFRRFFR